MAIDIPVGATFNTGEIQSQIAQINAQIKSLGASVAQATKQKFEPISLRSKEDLKSFVSQTQQLLKVQTELRNRMKETGQAGKMPIAADWKKLYPDAGLRNQKLQEVLGFYGNSFESISPQGGGRGGRGGGGGLPPKPDHRPPPGTMGHVVQSGLGAAGPVGRVAGGAINAGQAGGFGSAVRFGIAGLAAFGVAKAVGGVYDKMGEAEANEVAYDTLKRTLGDVNVAFGGLKATVKNMAEVNKVTYAESIRLSTMFAKAGNIRGDLSSMAGEVGVGVGMSRSFGLDPAQGVGVLGAMRGLGVTRSESDTRRFALLIGETIGKAGAFAKADEVMEAIAGYAASQARYSLTQNAAGYGDSLSALMSQGITGLDVGGSASLLSQVNNALRGGGAKGEASQFFSYGIASSLGLDPFEARLLREGGAFATKSNTFGLGGQANNFGFADHEGDQTFLSMTIQRLREQYGHLGPGALMEATANHLGISGNQAIAIQQMKSSDRDALGVQLALAGVNLQDMDASALSSLAQVQSGSAEDRMNVALSLRNRTGSRSLSGEDLKMLDEAMVSGDATKQTDVLSKLLAQYGQQETQGKDIRDSKALLENVNTNLAEKLIPITQSMRDGILYLAGGGDKSPAQMQRMLAEMEINERYDAQIENAWREGMAEKGIPFDHDDMFNRITNRRAILRNEGMDEIRAEVERLEQARRDELAGPRPTATGGTITPQDWRATAGQVVGEDDRYRPGMSATHGLGPIDLPSGIRANDALFNALIEQESGGRHYGDDGALLRSSAGARGITQLMPGTARDPGYGIQPVRNDSEEEYLRVGREYLDAMLREFNGDPVKALAAYNAGPGAVRNAISRHGASWLQNMSQETQNYVPSILGNAGVYNTPIPAATQGGQGGNSFHFDPLQVNVNVTGPGTATAPSELRPIVGRPSPMGAY